MNTFPSVYAHIQKIRFYIFYITIRRGGKERQETYARGSGAAPYGGDCVRLAP